MWRKRWHGISGFVVFATLAGMSVPATADHTGNASAAKETIDCTVNWKADSAVCKQQKQDGKCTTIHRGHYATLDDAKKDCEFVNGVTLDSGAESCEPCWHIKSATGDCLEHCKDLCYRMWEKCRDDCPKKDRNCLSECTNQLAKCNRECDRKCR